MTEFQSLIDDQKQAQAEAATEYRAVVLRSPSPQPADYGRLRQLQKKLALSAEQVAADLKAAVEAAKYERAIAALTAAEQRGDQMKITELGNAAERVRAKFQPQIDEAERAYEDARGTFDTLRSAAQMNENPYRQLKARNPRLFPSG